MLAQLNKQPEAESDAELMEQLAAGELSALGKLYDRHADAVRRFLVRATGELAAADDLTQDTFLTLAKVADRFDDTRAVCGFAIGIAAKLVLRRQRRRAITLRVFKELLGSLRCTDDRTPEDNAVVNHELAHFRRALDDLSPAKRITMLMADVEGLSGRRIAEALDIPLSTVWTRLHYARAEMRLALGAAG